MITSLDCLFVFSHLKTKKTALADSFLWSHSFQSLLATFDHDPCQFVQRGDLFCLDSKANPVLKPSDYVMLAQYLDAHDGWGYVGVEQVDLLQSVLDLDVFLISTCSSRFEDLIYCQPSVEALRLDQEKAASLVLFLCSYNSRLKSGIQRIRTVLDAGIFDLVQLINLLAKKDPALLHTLLKRDDFNASDGVLNLFSRDYLASFSDEAKRVILGFPELNQKRFLDSFWSNLSDTDRDQLAGCFSECQKDIVLFDMILAGDDGFDSSYQPVLKHVGIEQLYVAFSGVIESRWGTVNVPQFCDLLGLDDVDTTDCVVDLHQLVLNCLLDQDKQKSVKYLKEIQLGAIGSSDQADLDVANSVPDWVHSLCEIVDSSMVFLDEGLVKNDYSNHWFLRLVNYFEPDQMRSVFNLASHDNLSLFLSQIADDYMSLQSVKTYMSQMILSGVVSETTVRAILKNEAKFSLLSKQTPCDESGFDPIVLYEQSDLEGQAVLLNYVKDWLLNDDVSQDLFGKSYRDLLLFTCSCVPSEQLKPLLARLATYFELLMRGDDVTDDPLSNAFSNKDEVRLFLFELSGRLDRTDQVGAVMKFAYLSFLEMDHLPSSIEFWSQLDGAYSVEQYERLLACGGMFMAKFTPSDQLSVISNIYDLCNQAYHADNRDLIRQLISTLSLSCKKKLKELVKTALHSYQDRASVGTAYLYTILPKQVKTIYNHPPQYEAVCQRILQATHHLGFVVNPLNGCSDT